MRIVIDMQGAQSASRVRGIGRYSLSFIQAIARNRGEHDLVLALNGRFPETIETIREAFRHLLPKENIRIWEVPGPVRALEPENQARRRRAEIVYQAFLASLAPDIVHVTSLFEGFGDDAVTSIGRFAQNFPVSVTLYDVIPLHDPECHLDSNPIFKSWYSQKLEQLKRADLLLAISAFSARDASDRLGLNSTTVINVSSACSEVFHPLPMSHDVRSGFLSRLGIKRSFILTSGTIDPHKNLTGLFRAFAKLPKVIRQAHQIVLVGNGSAHVRSILADMARRAGLKKGELLTTGYVSDEDLVGLYNCCDLMVLPSTDEGFGLPALEAMTCGAPTIGSRAASIPEVIGREDALFDPRDEADMARLITRALTDKPFQEELKAHALLQAKGFSWDSVAQKALQEMGVAIQDSQKSAGLDAGDSFPACIQALAEVPADEAETLALAQSLAWTFPRPTHERQLLIDVSELAQRDARTGCQRVTRSILLEFLTNPPDGCRVEPVYATVEQPGYRYARTFVSRLMGQPLAGEDAPIDWSPGDIFFGLDYQAEIAAAQEPFLLQMRRFGVEIRFLVYDILSVTMPHCFMPGNEPIFIKWLETIAKFDGVIAISKATSDALKAWYDQHSQIENDSFRYDWIHLGADIDNSVPTFGLPDDAPAVLSELSRRSTFLMVGTLEPRKGYSQALAAFDLLWSRGADINLVIVGKEGWSVASLVDRIRRHPERRRRLYWLEGISDEYLEKVYAAADCLVAASEGEGFGLPLIEAARHELPILARNLPVFREVAGDHAAWFSGLAPENLADAIETWLALYNRGRHPRSNDIPWITWAESARRMAGIVLGK